MDPGLGMEFWNSMALVSVSPRKGRHQSPAAKKIRNDFIQDVRAAPGIIRWAKPFASTLNWLISPNGIIWGAACDRQPAAHSSNADFGSIFLIMHEVQLDRRTGPLAAFRYQKTRSQRRKFGRIAEI